MNLQTIVALSLIFNLSFNTLVFAGVGNLSGATGFSYSNFPTTAINFTSYAQPSKCNPSGYGFLTCNPIISGLQAFWGTLLTFGYFLWGVINILPQFAAAILIPAQFLDVFFGNGNPLVGDIQAILFFMYAMWAYVLWTGRYNAEIT